MIEAHSPTALEIRSPKQTRSAGYDAYRGELDRPAAVPAHLALLRDALARDALAHGCGRSPRAHRDGLCASGPVQAHRRHPARVTVARQLTLAQWVSRTTGIR
ncbi:hypothetical protein [Streptomyces shenzhenensis]|uniref:Uncharacterized protein n=1 Tax=Streptomyces shenzhenensis TaxID=943815 RepID=A0A3M0HVW7_9ACTN|nr:hypothetical protein [Streptomyces shenzhenensis]RMB80258.1 hypothetical protein CTZ28_41375 [Streptomyces shenzhenensis]